jgi:hypothetical protein
MKETERLLPLNQHGRPGGLRNLAGIDTKLLNLESLSEINRAGKAAGAASGLIEWRVQPSGCLSVWHKLKLEL